MFGNNWFERKLSEHSRRGRAVAVLVVGVMGVLPAAASAASGSGVAHPKPVVAQGVLDGVSCASVGACSAVGDHANGAGPDLTLADRWNGTSWAIQTTPSPAGASDTYLYGESCTSASACAAVGDDASSGVYTTVAERWNGTSWQLQSTPNLTGAEVSYLTGVSCASASSCIAVGYYAVAAGFILPLAERWNGISWKLQKIPTPAGSIETRLRGVSCTSASACTAVGFTVNKQGTGLTIAERWNGTSWQVQTTPIPTASQGSVLTAVSCASASACTAVGYYEKGTTGERTLAERWNGTSWQVQSIPSPAGADGGLDGVSCVSANACTTVGNFGTAAGEFALVERWDGTSWKLQSTPNPAGAKDAELNGVSCVSASACTAVGDYINSVTQTTLAEGWNGTSWTIQATPTPA